MSVRVSGQVTGTSAAGTAAVAGATLPFTGLPVALVAAIGLTLLLLGLVLFEVVRRSKTISE